MQWNGRIGMTGAYAVNPAALSDPWFAGTGFAPTATLPGLVGGEWDSQVPGCTVSLETVFFHYGGPPAPANATRYIALSGARIFDAIPPEDYFSTAALST